MRTKLSLFVLAFVALLLHAGVGMAAPARRAAVRWEGRLAAHQSSKLWIQNLSDRSAGVLLEDLSAGGLKGHSQAVSIEAGGTAEIPALPGDGHRLRLRSDADLFVLQLPEGLEPADTELAGAPAVRLDRTSKGLRATVSRADWVQGLLEGTSALAKGSTGAASVASERAGARIEVAVAFLKPDSSVRVRLLDSRGEEVTGLVASSSRPVQWRASLGELPPDGSARVELQALRGEVRGTAAAVEPGAQEARRTPVGTPVNAKTGGGVGYFSSDINWYYTPDLYYSVGGGPANTCGTLWAYRNAGPWTSTAGWICTDASGNATKGPWSWANQSGDETAYAYIDWGGGLTTNTSQHIWDKTCATATITSGGGNPPASLYGAGTDGAWGAGFDASWSSAFAFFQDTGTGNYWTPAAGAYNTTSNVSVSCSISGMPSLTVTWSCPQIPPGYTHQSGHCYQWTVCVPDGYCGYCDSVSFCT
ncbi:MAG: hypothetical protein ACJ76Y_05890 [Thermoanaerobaculia bacterium]